MNNMLVSEWNIMQLCNVFKKYALDGFSSVDAAAFDFAHVSYRDLDKLLNKGCEVHTALEILI